MRIKERYNSMGEQVTRVRRCRIRRESEGMQEGSGDAHYIID